MLAPNPELLKATEPSHFQDVHLDTTTTQNRVSEAASVTRIPLHRMGKMEVPTV